MKHNPTRRSILGALALAPAAPLLGRLAPEQPIEPEDGTRWFNPEGQEMRVYYNGKWMHPAQLELVMDLQNGTHTIRSDPRRWLPSA